LGGQKALKKESSADIKEIQDCREIRKTGKPSYLPRWKEGDLSSPLLERQQRSEKKTSWGVTYQLRRGSSLSDISRP